MLRCWNGIRTLRQISAASVHTYNVRVLFLCNDAFFQLSVRRCKHNSLQLGISCSVVIDAAAAAANADWDCARVNNFPLTFITNVTYNGKRGLFWHIVVVVVVVVLLLSLLLLLFLVVLLLLLFVLPSLRNKHFCSCSSLRPLLFVGLCSVGNSQRRG